MRKEKSQGLYVSNHLSSSIDSYFNFSTIQYICPLRYLIRCSKFKPCHRTGTINTIEDLLLGQFAPTNKHQQQLCIECHTECSRTGISRSHKTGIKGNNTHGDISPKNLGAGSLGCMKNKENLEAFAQLSNKDQECSSSYLGTSNISHIYMRAMNICSC